MTSHNGGQRLDGLSVCCVTHASPARTAAVLEPLRAVAAEFVLGVDARRRDQIAEYAVLADRVAIVSTGPVEHSLRQIYALCSGDWILRVDSDEIASVALIAALPALIARQDVNQYAIARRWLVGDGAHAVNEQPWWPDYQVRLTRRDAARHAAIVHEPLCLHEPRLYVIEPLYHLGPLLHDRDARQEKVVEYEIVHLGGPGTMREPRVRIYEPERHAESAPVPVPPEDLPALRRFAAAAGLPEVPDPVVGRPGRGAAARGADAVIELLETDTRVVRGETRTLTVRVTNLSPDTWISSPAPCHGFFVASRWHWPDGFVVEGPRSALPIPVAPGESAVIPVGIVGPSRDGAATLDVAVVHELVRWLEPPCRLQVTVSSPAPLPIRRDGVRAPRSGIAIPRVFHRVWLGDRAMPAAFDAYADTWQHHHPDWELRLWTDADAPTLPALSRARNLAERADLVRYEILRRHGGVYLDTDVECLRRIDELLDGVVAFAGYEVPGRVCNAVLGAVPGHPAFARAVALASIAAGHGTYPQATATTMLTYLLESHDDVTLFGPERFYSVLWDGTRYDVDEPPYAAHHWAASWTSEHTSAAREGQRAA